MSLVVCAVHADEINSEPIIQLDQLSEIGVPIPWKFPVLEDHPMHATHQTLHTEHGNSYSSVSGKESTNFACLAELIAHSQVIVYTVVNRIQRIIQFNVRN